MPKAPLFTRPDGRLRAAFIAPLLLGAFVLFAIVWQARSGLP